MASASIDLKSFTGDGTGAGNVSTLAFLAGAKDVFPHVDAPNYKDPPKFPGNFKEFAAANSHVVLQHLRNKIKKCSNCGKPNAFLLANCNQCGHDLRDTPITFSNNLFTGFIYGIAKAPFPLKISIRAQTEDLLVFDDLMALTTCHVNCIPTNFYIPDFRPLLERPSTGKAVVQKLFGACWGVAESQFLSNAAWVGKVMKPGAKDFKSHAIAGFNFPPSQYQLHLQFMMPPWTPFHTHLVLKGVHYTRGRFLPYEWVHDVLALNKPLPGAANKSIEEIFAWSKSMGVDYNAIYDKCMKRYHASQRSLGNWRSADFGNVALGDSALLRPSDKSVSDLVKADKDVLQNYGRPYTAANKPSGSYYKHAKTGKLPTFAEHCST